MAVEYPIQSQDFSTPPESVAREEEHHEVTYPRSIRALQDANDAEGHGRTLVMCL